MANQATKIRIISKQQTYQYKDVQCRRKSSKNQILDFMTIIAYFGYHYEKYYASHKKIQKSLINKAVLDEHFKILCYIRNRQVFQIEPGQIIRKCYLFKIIMKSGAANKQFQKVSKQESKDFAEGKSRIKRRAVNITFRSELNQAQINKVIIKHRKTISQSQWVFHFGEFKYMNVLEILNHARVLQIQSLTLHFCKHTNILKDIEPIYFPKLVSLNISGNKIGTLEPLERTYLPVLKNLFLRENLLTSLRSLRKCNFHLERLELSDNKLVTLDGLEQLDNSSLVELWGIKNQICLNWSCMKLQINFREITKVLFYGTLTVSPSRLQRALTVLGAQFVRIQ